VFVDEYQQLSDLILAGKYPEALTLLAELDEMGRDDKLSKIGSYARILLVHLVKRAAERETTASWERSIRESVRQVGKTNRNRKTKTERFTRDELAEVLDEEWEAALEDAAFELNSGPLGVRYSEDELERRVGRDAILAEALALLDAGPRP
jgi:uncharacterized protein DUF29